MNLPCDECRGKCCTFPAMSREEFRRIKAVHGFPKGAIKRKVSHKSLVIFMPNGACPYLTDGKCGVYALRPKACRDYGIVKELPCMYLYPEEARAQADKLGGGKILKDIGGVYE